MSLRSRNKPSTEFSSSSIADIVFLLLIYFLLASDLVNKVGLTVDLPSSKSDVRVGASNSVTITLDGQYAWNNDLLTQKEDLDPLIQAALTDDDEENDVIILRTDKEVTMEEAAYVMSEVSRWGGKIVIMTKKQ